jgi:tetratricopeptide (TPR) repeat protein/tRNA A-37 threonylcarbamoyl transferase component Bud32/TolB-like protein
VEDFRPRLEQALAGSYVLERELGGGGMSRTYLARELALSRRVVVKVLSPELLQGISVERFKREVLLAAGLQHPHVVPVLSAGDAGGIPWFTMPYVDGESLRKRLEEGRLGVSDAIAILRDVAKALMYAHAHGVVHRDIKPDNVLLSTGSATVTDFGIAKAISASRTDSGGATLTQAGMAIGTPAYMAPEQAAGDRALDHRADLYAFGAMAYEMLAGQHVFPGLTPARALVAHLSEAPRDLRTLRPDVPPALADLVMRCLAKDPAARPQDAATIVRVLDNVGTSGSATAAPAVLLAPRMPLARALALWAVVATAIVGTAWGANEAFGLPDWAFTGAVGVALAGLPGVLVTWWVQRVARRHAINTPTLTPGGTPAPLGTMATFAIKASPHVSWTRTWRAGAAAVGVLVLLVSSYIGTRAMGIGPAASLMGTGAFAEHERIVVADFHPPANDSLLGVTVAEALRTDLAQSENLRVMSRATVREVLGRMQRSSETAVLFPVAREIATREGAKALIDGEVVRVGTAYVLSARLVSASTGEELATFRETAGDDAALIGTVGTLARSIRERVGESLKSIRATQPLERVTTASLPALRKYMEGIRGEERGDDPARVIASVREAVALDTTFAMGWRKLALLLRNNQAPDDQVQGALASAWRFRDRLTEEERALLEGSYYTYGPEPDAPKAAAALEQLVARDPRNPPALNALANLGLRYGRFARAESLYRQAAALPGSPVTMHQNLARVMGIIGRPAAAMDSVVRDMQARFPTASALWEARSWALFARGELDSAEALVRGVAQAPASRRAEELSLLVMSSLLAYRGRADESLAYATRISRARAKDIAGDDGSPMGRALVRNDAALDSATVDALLRGDAERARRLLERAVADRERALLAPEDRRWDDVAAVAAIVGDGAVASAAHAGYVKDLMPSDAHRGVMRARMDAFRRMADGDWEGAIAEGRGVLPKLETPWSDLAFTMAMAHERAGRPDSAIAWYERAATVPEDRFGVLTFVRPAAHRRLAELYDRRGDLAKAIEHYDWIVRTWKRADPSLQPVVQAARARAAELRARQTPG